MQETRVQSLGWEDPLEEKMATHSGILAWRIPWIEEPGRPQSVGSQRVGHDLATEWACICIHISMMKKSKKMVHTRFRTEFGLGGRERGDGLP